jgi:hypothetical protein
MAMMDDRTPTTHAREQANTSGLASKLHGQQEF